MINPPTAQGNPLTLSIPLCALSGTYRRRRRGQPSEVGRSYLVHISEILTGKAYVPYTPEELSAAYDALNAAFAAEIEQARKQDLFAKDCA